MCMGGSKAPPPAAPPPPPPPAPPVLTQEAPVVASDTDIEAQAKNAGGSKAYRTQGGNQTRNSLAIATPGAQAGTGSNSAGLGISM